MKRFSVVLVSLLIFVACQKTLSTSEIMNSWMGHHISEVIQSWGPYQQAIPNGQGGMIYSWQSPVQVTMPVYGTILSRTVVRHQTFYVRPDGIIYYWRTQGY